jgi:hypothetical protein
MRWKVTWRRTERFTSTHKEKWEGFDPEDGGSMFLWNVGVYQKSTQSYNSEDKHWQYENCWICNTSDLVGPFQKHVPKQDLNQIQREKLKRPKTLIFTYLPQKTLRKFLSEHYKYGALTGLQAGWPGFDPSKAVFLSTTTSRLALGPTQPPIQWGVHSLGVKQPGCETDHSPPSCAKVKNVWSYISPPLPHTSAWHGAKLRTTDHFTLP